MGSPKHNLWKLKNLQGEMGDSGIWIRNIFKKISNTKIDMYAIGYKYYLIYFIRYWFISLLINYLLKRF